MFISTQEWFDWLIRIKQFGLFYEDCRKLHLFPVMLCLSYKGIIPVTLSNRFYEFIINYFLRIWMFLAVTAKQQRKSTQAIQSRMKLLQQWWVWCRYCWLPTHSIVPGSLLKHIRHHQLSFPLSNTTAPESSLMISERLTTGSDKTLLRYSDTDIHSFIHKLWHYFYFAVYHSTKVFNF